MKKLTLIAVLLLVMGLSMGFALDLKPGLSLSGSASVKWGVDLSDYSTGFENSGSADLKITLLPADQSDTHAGSGAVYGSIKFSDLELEWIDGTLTDSLPHEPSISATIFMAPIQVDIYGAPGMTANTVAPIEDITANGVYFGLDKTLSAIQSIIDDEASLTSAYGGGGLDVKYSDPAGLFWAQVDLKSEAGVLANNTQAYAGGLEAGVTLKPINFAFGVFQGANYAANPLAFYASVGYSDDAIGAASLGVDFVMPAAGTIQYEIGANADLHFNKEGTAFVALKGLVDFNQNLDILVALAIPSGTLMGALDLKAAAYILDVLLANENSAYATLGYQVDLSETSYVKPQLTAAFGLAAGGAAGLNLKPGVEIGIAKSPLTTITIEYVSGDLLATPAGLGQVAVTAAITY